jgi:hypothetical protein
MSALTFIYNKYTRIYNNIIERAKARTTSGYVENHHIIPRSLGGSNNKSNLVALTAREHFICHLLLTRITQGQDKKKMIRAVFYLTGRGKADRNNYIKSSRLYENLKTQLSAIVSEQKKGCKQPPRSELARQRYSDSKTGKNNPNHKGHYITPWGRYESSRLASKACPDRMSDVAILNFCTAKNSIPISYLSICRSKGYLNQAHVGLTPFQLGFAFQINT